MSFNFEIKLDNGFTLKNLMNIYKHITDNIEIYFYNKGLYIIHSNAECNIIVSTHLDNSWFLKNDVTYDDRELKDSEWIGIKTSINGIIQCMKTSKKSENITISNDEDSKNLYFKYSEGEDSATKSVIYEYCTINNIQLPFFKDNLKPVVVSSEKLSENFNNIPVTPCSIITNENHDGFIFVGNAVKTYNKKDQPGVLSKFGNCDEFENVNTKIYYIDGKYLKALNKLKSISYGTVKIYLENDILKFVTSVGCYGNLIIYIKCAECKN